MEKIAETIAFNAIQAHIQACSTTLHEYVSGHSNTQINPLKIVPQYWESAFHGLPQSELVELTSTIQLLENEADAIITHFSSGSYIEAQSALDLFKLKTDNLSLQLELLDLKQNSQTQQPINYETEFYKVVMQSPIAMCIFSGRDLIIEMANNAMEGLWRMELAAVKGLPVLEVFPELKQQKYAELLHAVMDTGITHREYESLAYVTSHDGTNAYYLDYEYSPLYDNKGAISGVMCTVDNVTDKVNARLSKEKAQKRHAHLIQTLPIAMYTIDANGYIDLYNQAAEILWGRRPKPGIDRWCGSYKLATLDGDDVPHDKCPMAMAFKEGRSIQEEIYMYREDGNRRHVIVHPQALHDEDGQVVGASKVMIDITERIEADDALRRSEQKFRLLSESIPQFIWTADPDGTMDYFSDSVSRYSGISPQQLLEHTWAEICHPEEYEETINRWNHSIKTGNDFIVEHRLKHYNGDYQWFLSRATTQRDEYNNIIQWVGTSTDIDEQKAFQKTLETVVEERTYELKKANIDLQNMNKELSSFAYISSHDLQEPLRKIQTFGSMIMASEEGNLSETGKKNLTRMQVAAARMTKLIQDLLTYSRANATEKTFEPTNLNAIMADITAELAETLQEKGGIISCCKLPVINAIPFQVRQLFTNLISNAIKFAKSDEAPVVNVSAQTVMGSVLKNPNAFPKKKYLHIAVTDNGIGFSQEYANRIFEVFQRLHGKAEYEGTGIGLAICSKIAENHEAIIDAVSQPNRGATFNVYFPL
jgi:PAS domain S-box-containing protein